VLNPSPFFQISKMVRKGREITILLHLFSCGRGIGKEWKKNSDKAEQRGAVVVTEAKLPTVQWEKGGPKKLL